MYQNHNCFYLIYVFLVFLFLSCKTERKDIFSPSNLTSFKILINPAKDTTFNTPKGATLSIRRGSFDKATILEIKEAYSMNDIVLGGLVTESEGQPLISGGMIYINTIDKKDVEPRFPIAVTIPTNYMNPAMQLYKGEEKEDGTINWINPDTLPATNQLTLIEEGKTLFQQSCRTCHGINKILTGPALRGFTQRGPWTNKQNIYDWIHYPAAFMSKDPYALNLKRQFGSIMQAFPQLANEQIDAIIAYIQNEQNNPIADADITSFDYNTPASQLCTDTLYSNNRTNPVDTTPINIADSPIYIGGRMIDTALDEPNEGLRNGFTDTPTSGNYQFEIQTLGWYNIDVQMKGLPGTYLCELSVELIGSDFSGVNVYAFFPQHKNLSVGDAVTSSVFHFNKIQGKIPLFLGSKGFILAFGSKSNQLFAGSSFFFTQPTQKILVRLKPVTKDELYEIIKEGKLEGINTNIEKATQTLEQSNMNQDNNIQYIEYNKCFNDSTITK